MKNIVLFLLAFYASSFLMAQNPTSKNTEHKIIFQLSTPDTMAHKALMKQLGNILTVAPNTKIEIVCHGPGLDILLTNKSVAAEKVKSFIGRGVVFNACEFSIKERNVDKNLIFKEATYVPAGIVEIVSKQEQGWSYIKAGF